MVSGEGGRGRGRELEREGEREKERERERGGWEAARVLQAVDVNKDGKVDVDGEW